ncbi:MAG: hypothetical protein Q8904_09500 [Bacteroidota bacterium]|nr:hypothetical protein [Bacteroidota bacterium]
MPKLTEISHPTNHLANLSVIDFDFKPMPEIDARRKIKDASGIGIY